LWIKGGARKEIKHTHTPTHFCLKYIGLGIHILLTILGSVLNISGGDLHDNLIRMRIFTLTVNKIFVWTPEIMEESGYKQDLGFFYSSWIFCVFHNSTRSECRAENVQLRSGHL
jgi:hypothetical protein